MRKVSSTYNAYSYYGSGTVSGILDKMPEQTPVSDHSLSIEMGQIILEGLQRLRSIDCTPDWNAMAQNGTQAYANEATAKRNRCGNVSEPRPTIEFAAKGRRLLDDIAAAFEHDVTS